MRPLQYAYYCLLFHSIFAAVPIFSRLDFQLVFLKSNEAEGNGDKDGGLYFIVSFPFFRPQNTLKRMADKRMAGKSREADRPFAHLF